MTVERPNGTHERRFWQAGGGFDGNLDNPEALRRVLEYFHQNPVRRGLVEHPED